MKIGTLPPLGVGYLASALEAHNHAATLIDAPSLGWDLRRVIQEIAARCPDIVGISCLTTCPGSAYALAAAIKEKHPDMRVVMGGLHVSFCCDTILDACPDIDAAFPGEAEHSFSEYVNRVEQGHPYHDVPGILFRDIQGNVINTGLTPVVKDLDSLAPPARHIYEKSLYRSLPNQGRQWPAATIVTSRGCPWSRCRFCFQRTGYGHQYRRRKPECCVQEVRELVVKHGYREVMFWDDNFCVNEDWINRFCDLLDRESFRIPWTVEGHIRTIKPAMLERMSKSGCYNIFLGIESGNQQILDMLEKGYTVERCWEVMKWIREVGMESRAAFLIGFPTETPEMARQTISFACDLDPDYANFVPFHVWPGAPIEEFALRHGRRMDWSGTLVKPSYVPDAFQDVEEINDLVKEAYRRFYFRPRVFARTLKGLRYRHGWRRAAAGLKYLLSI